MASRRRISDKDAEEFQRAVSGARPLVGDRVHLPARRPAARPQPQAPSQAVSDALMPDGIDERSPSLGERQHFARGGVQNRLLRRLARGQIQLDGELDLHGMRVEEARRALSRFLAESLQQGARCVRVITGKGYGSRSAAPVLKGQVDRWLRLRPEILAFCSATPRDGGTGAVYVLLARSRASG